MCWWPCPDTRRIRWGHTRSITGVGAVSAYCCSFASHQFRFISAWSREAGPQPLLTPSAISQSSRYLQLLQPLFTRSWPQHIHFSHFITVTSDSNLLPNWVSTSAPDIQVVRWISSSAWLAWTLRVSGQWPIKCPLPLCLQPRLPSREWQCGVSHCDLSSCLELIILELLERLSD